MTDTIEGAPALKDQCVKRKRSRAKRELPQPPAAVVERLEERLPADVLDAVLADLEPEQITGSGGLLTQLAGRVIEAALGAELTDHLGYEHGQPPPAAKHTRSGSRSSTPSPTASDRAAGSTSTPRSRSTTTPRAPPAGPSTARPASRSPNRSTPRYATTPPA